MAAWRGRARLLLGAALLAAAALHAAAQGGYCPSLPLSYPGGEGALAPAEFEPGAHTIVDLRWMGADSGFVLALTSGGRLWRSVNGGTVWSDDTARLLGALDNRGVAAIVSLERFPFRVMFQGHFNASLRTTLMWATSDRGYTYHPPCALSASDGCVGAPTDAALVEVKPHPAAQDVLAAMSQARVCAGASAACVLRDVWTSLDFGHTWRSALAAAAAGGEAAAVAGFIDFGWAPAADASPASSTLLATGYTSADAQLHGVYFAGFWDKQVHLLRSDDYFASRSVLRRCGNDFRAMSDGRLYLGVAAGCDAPPTANDGWAVTLEVSRDGGASWAAACFPSFEAEHGYTLFDLPNGPAFVHVDHSDTKEPLRAGQPLGVLYHADAAGALFSLSARDVLLQPSGVSDFMPAPGVPGVAFANAADPALWAEPAFLRGDATVYDALQTRATRDAGANWAPLPAPAPLPGQPPCAADCALQLHGPDAAWRGALNASYGGVYAPAGAPGVVWATGSVGRRLSYAPAQVRTFLSLDGGATWATVAGGATTYETGAYGACGAGAAAPQRSSRSARCQARCWSWWRTAPPAPRAACSSASTAARAGAALR
jgi:hypothetical protein